MSNIDDRRRHLREIALGVVALLGLGGCVGWHQRSVKGLTLVSESCPRVVVRLESGFHYAGRFSFTLGNSFIGERYVFVDADGPRLRRLCIAHFERIQAGRSEIYHYDLDRGSPIGPLRFLQNEFAFTPARRPWPDPKNEAERTDNFLLARGFRLPKVWLASRLVTLGGPDRKSELILFYMEESVDLSMSDLYQGDDPTPVWRQSKPELAQRARAAFQIE